MSNLIFSNNFILLSDFIENNFFFFLLPLRPELLTRKKMNGFKFHLLSNTHDYLFLAQSANNMIIASIFIELCILLYKMILSVNFYILSNKNLLITFMQDMLNGRQIN